MSNFNEGDVVKINSGVYDLIGEDDSQNDILGTSRYSLYKIGSAAFYGWWGVHLYPVDTKGEKGPDGLPMDRIARDIGAEWFVDGDVNKSFTIKRKRIAIL